MATRPAVAATGALPVSSTPRRPCETAPESGGHRRIGRRTSGAVWRREFGSEIDGAACSPPTAILLRIVVWMCGGRGARRAHRPRRRQEHLDRAALPHRRTPRPQAGHAVRGLVLELRHARARRVGSLLAANPRDAAVRRPRRRRQHRERGPSHRSRGGGSWFGRGPEVRRPSPGREDVRITPRPEPLASVSLGAAGRNICRREVKHHDAA